MSSIREEPRDTTTLTSSVAIGSAFAPNTGVSSMMRDKPRNYDFTACFQGAELALTANTTSQTLQEQLQLASSLPAVSSHPFLSHTLLPSSISPLAPIGQTQLATAIASRNAAAARLVFAKAQQEYADVVRRLQIVQEEAAEPLSHNRTSMPPVPTFFMTCHRETSIATPFVGHMVIPRLSDHHLEAIHASNTNPVNIRKDVDASALQSASMHVSSSASAEAFTQNKRKAEPDFNYKPQDDNCHNPDKKRKQSTGNVRQEKKARKDAKPMQTPSSSEHIKKIPPKELPRRPLNAYNFFFSEEREKILNSLGCGGESESTESEVTPPPEEVPADQPWHAIPLMQRLAEQHRSKKRRPHRKTHGKIGFKDLTKLVAARWRNLPPERVKHYKELAQMDLKRYEVEIEWWTSKGYTSQGKK